MNIYSNKSINIMSLILTIIIFFILNLFINIFSNFNLNSIEFSEKLTDENIINVDEKNQEKEDTVDKDYSWYIQIRSINLKAPIEETTDVKVLSRSVGHFKETALKEGNIGLAAHNRGYEVNYFENLKSVKMGDEIIYHYNNFSKKYIVDKIEIIKETDWSYLEKSKDNKITLITCVENEPKLRRCVQAVEKE